MFDHRYYDILHTCYHSLQGGNRPRIPIGEKAGSLVLQLNWEIVSAGFGADRCDLYRKSHRYCH